MTSGRGGRVILMSLRRGCAWALLAWCVPGLISAQAPEPEIIRIAAPDATILELPPLRPHPTTVTEPSRPAAPMANEKPSRRAAAPPARLSEQAIAAPVPLGPKAVPISLDTVMQLARDQNGQVRMAREKLMQAYAEQELADKRWIPEILVGAGTWRHEGGIQDFNGELLHSSFGSAFVGLEARGKIDVRDRIFVRLDAERKIWQQQGELSKFSSDQLLDAAGTYIDLLSARSAEAIGLEAETRLNRLVVQAKSLEKIDAGVRVEVARVEAELGAQKILTRRLRENATSAAAKLIYLLGLDPASELVPLEKQIVAFRLVDAHQPTEALVETALRAGPGVQELEAILGLLEEARAKGNSPIHWLPMLEVKMTEGAFGAGPGSRLDWDNRWDLGVQARWNLTELLTKNERKRLGDLKIQQAHLGYQDLRAKLTLGVHEACEAIRSSQEQLSLATRQIVHAEETFNLSDQRLRENIKGRSPSEVLLAIRGLVGARLGYLNALRDHDKAQLRLFVLTGGACLSSAAR